jgi:hypothetical protein
VGGTIGNAIEVMAGVREGERIISLGAELVRNGEEVRVLSL